MKIIVLTLFLHVVFENTKQVHSEIDMDYCSLAPPCAAALKETDPTFLLDCTILYDVGVEERSKSLSCCAPEGSKVTWYIKGEGDNQPIELEKSGTTFRESNDLRYIVSDKLEKNDEADYNCSVNIAGVIYNKSITLHVMKPDELDFEVIAPAFEENKRIYVITDGLGEEVGLLWSAALVYSYTGEFFNQLKAVWDVPEGFTYINGNNVTYKYTGGNRAVIFSSLNVSKFDLEPNYQASYNFKCTYSSLGGTEYIEYQHDVAELRFMPDPTADPTKGYQNALIVLAVCLVMLLLVSWLVAHFHIEIRMVLKDKFAPLEVNGDFDYDVFVCYNSEDGHDTVGKVLLPKLERFGYKCFVYERDAHAGANLSLLLPMALKRSRRMLIVVSPGLFYDGLALHMCHVGVQEAISKHSLRIITVLPSRMKKQKLTEEELANGAHLRTILRVSRSVTLPTNCEKERQRFWKKLRLDLPPRRKLVPISDHPIAVTCVSSEASTSLLAFYSASTPKNSGTNN